MIFSFATNNMIYGYFEQQYPYHSFKVDVPCLTREMVDYRHDLARMYGNQYFKQGCEAIYVGIPCSIFFETHEENKQQIEEDVNDFVQHFNLRPADYTFVEKYEPPPGADKFKLAGDQ